MYISTCSVALVQHWHAARQRLETALPETVLDLCCGSGVQGIAAAAAAAARGGECSVTAVDVSARAVRFTRFNAALNGLARCVTAVQGDLYSASGIGDRTYAAILANPPFVPVPPALNAISNRYDVFAAGPGARGEGVLRGVIEGACAHLRPGGTLAIVSEVADVERFVGALPQWWSSGSSAQDSVLQPAMSALEYCQRRAGSSNEVEAWVTHLASESIESLSQAFMWVVMPHASSSSMTDVDSSSRSDSGGNVRIGIREGGCQVLMTDVKLVRVSKVWAPENYAALRVTTDCVKDLRESNS
ncbi:S-adenosyl-L-methionine-dependent methyltransferase [Tribonema minus]|uniref:S-adenosyl-L-methionine-dependent methyltransferase n=1 Tax=Tribonema minus TaxID=303371 RepID=A0A836C8B5_9STRA|nr:S-adenosyl-L-methionine-dependent methyltransferase [Tribonema minus]